MTTRTLAIPIALGLLLAGGPLAAQVSKLSKEHIDGAISGNTVSFVTDDLSKVEAFAAPGGELRGAFKGENFTGRWSVSEDRLCFELPNQPGLSCRTVTRKPNGELQLFTTAGKPAGELTIEEGNPSKF